MNREVREMVTRGTYQARQLDEASELLGYEPKFILAYKKSGPEIGVTFFDVQTLKMYIGEFKEEDESMQKLRTLIC